MNHLIPALVLLCLTLACAGWNFAVCAGPKGQNVSVCVGRELAFPKHESDAGD